MNEIIASAVSLTRELVRVPSESSDAIATPGSAEFGVAAVLQRVCCEHDLDWHLQEALPDRYNFIVSCSNPGLPKVIFLAHMDTVSAKGMVAPFSGELKNGKVWGRGSCDDKGSLAAILAVLVELKQQKTSLKYDVTLAATVDEECSMSGSAVLAKKNPLGWDLCIGMEPTLLQPVYAHRGVYRCRILAIKEAVLPVSEIMAGLRDFQHVLEQSCHPELGNAVMNSTEILEDDSRHRILVDIRLLPVQSPAQIHASIVRIVGTRGRVIPLFAGRGIDTDPETALVKSFQRSLLHNGLDATLKAVPFATDCSQLQGRGPCMVWGPGNSAQAHQADEFIELRQLELACQVLAGFLTTS
nr:M20/M25/M40 family metallo-hydrolase [Desulfobulbaceae bacterium]